MKPTVPALIAFCLLLITGCKNNPSGNVPASTAQKDSTLLKDSVAAQSFFPVPAYIGGELKMIDSLQLPLSMTVTVGTTSKSRVATDKELRSWAVYFQEPDISGPALKQMYTETSIADQGVPSVTFIYSTANSRLPVQKINVYVKPDPVQNDKVTGVYIEKLFTVLDTVISQKLYWKTGKNLQVTTEKKVKGIALPVEQVKITWDPS